MAFVTPASTRSLTTSAARRATTCPLRPNRNVVTMKKVRRGEDDSKNAVDVFAGAGLSQKQLLADALGEDLDSSAKKEKKKKKKKDVMNDEENAVDVFGGVGLSQEDLLKTALGEGDEKVQTISKKKKGKKGATIEENNAVDVFSGNDSSQKDLLKDALGENVEQSQHGTKKKNKSKRGTYVEEDSGVDVFSGNALSQEELLKEALGDRDATPSEQKKKKKKDKKAITVDSDKDVDFSGGGTLSQGELFAGAPDEPDFPTSSDLGKSRSHEEKNGVKGLESTSVIQEDPLNIMINEENEAPLLQDIKQGSVQRTAKGKGKQRENGAKVGEDAEEIKVFDDDTAEDDTEGIINDDEEEVEENDETFEPDAEVVDEFETASKTFLEFTAKGRREAKVAKRKERNETEGKLADLKKANYGSGGEKFTSVRLEDVTVVFRNTTILRGVTWGVRTGERVGLIGENGCGKTTQLKIMAGLLEPTSGEVVRSSQKTKASFLRQEFVDELDPRRTLREEFLSAFQEESRLILEYQQCEKDIEDAGGDLEKLGVLLDRLEELRVKCDERGAWNLESRVDKVMPGLGFDEDDNDKLVASFSGGWKVRIGLGKVLLQDPDLLLLDEPSNHLDHESIEWLEEFLQSCKLPMVVVSHDREFLDRVCTKIVDIDGGEAFEYPGNYTKFVKLKAELRKAWEAAYERQQKFIKEQESYIKRNRRSPARASQVKSREKMLERMKRTGQLVRRPPRQGKPLIFRFPPAPRSGQNCIIIDDLTHGYNERNLFEGASITIERGDRIALIGPNGSGKSTLLRLVTGIEEPQHGAVDCKELTNINLAYYEQNQADALDLDVSVLETLKQAAPLEIKYEEIRALLGKFLFKGDDVEKTVGALSGGEKARLALAKIMLEPANVLVLDEPGNHLSISAKEMLEEALQHFDGTLLVVSHDRYLTSQVATQILAVEDRDLVLYDGDYKSYMEKNSELSEKLKARSIPGVAEIKSAPKIVIEEPSGILEKKQKRKKNFGGSGINSGKTKEMNAKRWKK